MSIQQSNNFFAFHCAPLDQRRYLSACSMIIQRIANSTDEGLWDDCISAGKKCRCAALDMINEELSLWDTKFYVDRDDCGPGIAKRSEIGQPERGVMDIAAHHGMLERLNITPYVAPIISEESLKRMATREASVNVRREIKPAVLPTAEIVAMPSPRPATVAASFDLGDLLNRELAKVS